MFSEIALVPGFPSWCGKETIKLYLAILLNLGSAVAQIGTSLLPGLCLSVIASGNYSSLTLLFIICAFAFVGLGVVNAAVAWVGRILSLYWYEQ